jgi:hypothetical protein
MPAQCRRCKRLMIERRIAGRIILDYCDPCYTAVYGSVQEAKLALTARLLRAERDAEKAARAQAQEHRGEVEPGSVRVLDPR